MAIERAEINRADHPASRAVERQPRQAGGDGRSDRRLEPQGPSAGLTGVPDSHDLLSFDRPPSAPPRHVWPPPRLWQPRVRVPALGGSDTTLRSGRLTAETPLQAPAVCNRRNAEHLAREVACRRKDNTSLRLGHRAPGCSIIAQHGRHHRLLFPDGPHVHPHITLRRHPGTAVYARSVRGTSDGR